MNRPVSLNFDLLT